MNNYSYFKFLADVGHREIDEKNYQMHYKFYLLNYQKFMPQNKTAKILDIGCGLGHFLYFCLKLGYEDITGVDIDPQIIEWCKMKVPKCKLEHISDIIDFLESSSTYYDFIIMNDVLEHIPKYKIIPTLNSIYNKLTPGGVLIIKTPNAISLLHGFTRYGDFTHEISFTESSLLYCLACAGFNSKNIRFYSEKYVVSSIKDLIRYILRKFIDRVTKLLYKIEKIYSPKITSCNIIAVAKKEV